MEFLVNDKGTLIKIDGVPERKVVLPDSVVRTGKGVFANKKEVEEVVMSSSTDYIGEQSFLSCSNLKYIDLRSVEKILKDAFRNCVSLESVVLPSPGGP